MDEARAICGLFRNKFSWHAGCCDLFVQIETLTTLKTNQNMKHMLQTLRMPALLAVSLTASVLTGFAAPSLADGTVSPVQSPADPMKLPLAGKVMAAGSDASSQAFDANILPDALVFIKANLPEGVNNSKSPIVEKVDPSKLVLASKTDVTATFVYEGAGYHNTLGINTTGLGVNSGNPEIIFPDASSTDGFDNQTTPGMRTPSEPLLPGDFVDLGTYAAGTKLDFFLIANGANGGTSVYNSIAGTSTNPDKLNHVGMFSPTMFASPDLNSPYVFVTFEDLLGGGDRDYNDTIFAFNVGSAAVHALFAAPEPSMYLTLGGFLALGIWATRRMNRQEMAGQS
jgi:hypothetical protein